MARLVVADEEPFIFDEYDTVLCRLNPPELAFEGSDHPDPIMRAKAYLRTVREIERLRADIEAMTRSGSFIVRDVDSRWQEQVYDFLTREIRVDRYGGTYSITRVPAPWWWPLRHPIWAVRSWWECR